MKKKFIFGLLLITSGLFSNIVIAQTEFELPEDITLELKEDYEKYDSIVVEAAKWLEETDLNKENLKHYQVKEFILKWVSGSPAVKITIGHQLVKVLEKNEELLFIYMASYSRHAIQTKNYTDAKMSAKAGLASIMYVYKKGIQMKRNKEMEKIIKMTDAELDNYISSKLLE